MIGPVRPVARARAVDDPRIRPAHRLVAEPEAVQHARPIVLDQDVGGLDQPPQHLFALIALQVERHAALVAVREEEEDALAVEERLRAGPGSLIRASTRWLDLHHVGAQVGKELYAGRALQKVGEAEDVDAGEEHA